MLSPSLEDYLEETYRLQLRYPSVRVSDIAACLNVSLPSVVKALKRLEQEGYIYYRHYSGIQLTPMGRKKGAFLVERNRIIRDFLNSLDCSCDVSAEAEAMEHYLSDSTVHIMRNVVDFMHLHPDIQKKFHAFCKQRNIKTNI